jgi:hypothetical protein
MSDKKQQQPKQTANVVKATHGTFKGPEPERLKIEGNWVKAVDAALRKPKPPEGWPK